MTYDIKTLKALLESIDHWDRLAAGKPNPREKVGWEDCALCALFLNPPCPTDVERCTGCPVRNRTGRKYCHGSPYDAAEQIAIPDISNQGAPQILNTVEFIEAAKLELEFLRSLLPDTNDPIWTQLEYEDSIYSKKVR
jgi:hypothetical protein